jgi:hypothetical protein
MGDNLGPNGLSIAAAFRESLRATEAMRLRRMGRPTPHMTVGTEIRSDYAARSRSITRIGMPFFGSRNIPAEG